MRETVHHLASAHTRNERTIWMRGPSQPAQPCDLLVLLDGEFYRDSLSAIETLDALHHEHHGPHLLTVFVSNHSDTARRHECPCHPPFADFVTQELLPWVEQHHPAVKLGRHRVLGGLSYTGLAAAFVALRAPGRFTRVIAQSGSFWWNDGWLTGQYAKLPAARPTEFYLEVGTREIQENVHHGEGVRQKISQIEGVRRFRDALLATGHRVHYREFVGGHDFSAWKQTLPGALRWALGQPAP